VTVGLAAVWFGVAFFAFFVVFTFGSDTAELLLSPALQLKQKVAKRTKQANILTTVSFIFIGYWFYELTSEQANKLTRQM
jgi:hypothetical protein